MKEEKTFRVKIGGEWTPELPGKTMEILLGGRGDVVEAIMVTERVSVEEAEEIKRTLNTL